MDVLCDFAVSGRRRLSKLVPMLIRATEVREYLEKKEWIPNWGRGDYCADQRSVLDEVPRHGVRDS